MVTEQFPTVGKKTTEQRVLLSPLCVLTNQRQHTEALSRRHSGGLTGTWLPGLVKRISVTGWASGAGGQLRQAGAK